MPYIGYAFVLLICIVVTLVCFTKIKPRLYPAILYLTGLGMILMTTCAGPYLVGSDIHMEYYYAQLHSDADVWQPIWHIPQGTSIANNVIAPTFPWPLLWTYKVVYPMIFATTPILLYYVFRKWANPVQAFLAAFVFISFSPFFVEIPTIARQMIAETELVLVLYFVLRSTWPNRYRMPALACLGALLPLTHYSTLAAALVILGIGLLVALVLRLPYKTPILVALLAAVAVSSAYFPVAEDGAVLRKFVHTYNSYVSPSQRVNVVFLELPELPPEATPSEPSARQPTPSWPEQQKDLPFLDKYSTLIAIGLGGDFLETNDVGRAFRVCQWLILLLVPVGLWRLRKLKSYWIFAGGTILISALCLIPGWANLLNITRFFHLSLLMLALPVAVSLRPKYLLIVLVPYFLFTSGIIFEVTRQPDVESVTAPYSVGLSDYRIDLGATTTVDDIKVRDYIVEHELFPINSDAHGANLLQEAMGPMGPRSDLNIALPKAPQPLEGYIFVRSRNARDGTFSVWKDIGQKKYWPLEDFGVTEDSIVIFQSEDAKVLRVEGLP